MGLRVNYAAMENCGSAVIVLVSFLRGQLTNHGTPRTLRLPGRNQVAPVWWTINIISPAMNDRGFRATDSKERFTRNRPESSLHSRYLADRAYPDYPG